MNKNQIKKLIYQKELEIKNLHLHQASNQAFESLYNSLILEKAILKKELDKLEKNKLIICLEKILHKKEKLICDYFKS